MTVRLDVVIVDVTIPGYIPIVENPSSKLILVLKLGLGDWIDEVNISSPYTLEP